MSVNKVNNMPSQEQIKIFHELFDGGWSITYSMSKARISGQRYKAFIDSDKDLKARIEKYKYNKRRTTKCTYEGRPLSYAECEHLGIEKEFIAAKEKADNMERTKAIIESIKYIQVDIPHDENLLPRGLK